MHGPDGQDGELEQEHDHHGGLGGGDDGVDGVVEQPAVVEDAGDEADDEAGVEQARVGGGLLLEDLDAALADPAPDLARDEGGEHDEEEGADLLAEDGHGEAGLGDGEPGPLVELLDLDGPQGAEAQPLETVHERAVQEEDQVDEDHQAEVGLRQVHHGRVEVGALVEGRCDDRRGQGRRGAGVHGESHRFRERMCFLGGLGEGARVWIDGRGGGEGGWEEGGRWGRVVRVGGSDRSTDQSIRLVFRVVSCLADTCQN